MHPLQVSSAGQTLPSYFPAPGPDDRIGSSCSGWDWLLPACPDTAYSLRECSRHTRSGHCNPAVRQKPAALHKRVHLRQLPDTAAVRGSPHPPAPDHCFLLRPQTGRRIPHQRAHVPRRQSLPSPGTCLQTLDPLSGISWKTHWQCNSPVHPCSSGRFLPPPAPRSH